MRILRAKQQQVFCNWEVDGLSLQVTGQWKINLLTRINVRNVSTGSNIEALEGEGRH